MDSLSRKLFHEQSQNPYFISLIFGVPLVVAQILSEGYEIHPDFIPLSIAGVFLILGLARIWMKKKYLETMEKILFYFGSILLFLAGILYKEGWDSNSFQEPLISAFGLLFCLLASYFYHLRKARYKKIKDIQNHKSSLSSMIGEVFPIIILGIITLISNSVASGFFSLSLYYSIIPILPKTMRKINIKTREYREPSWDSNQRNSYQYNLYQNNLSSHPLRKTWELQIYRVLLFLLFLEIGYIYQNPRSLGVMILSICGGWITGNYIQISKTRRKLAFIIAPLVVFGTYAVLCFIPMMRYVVGLEIFIGLAIGLLMSNDWMNRTTINLKNSLDRFKRHWSHFLLVLSVISGITVAFHYEYEEFIWPGFPGIRKEFVYESVISMSLIVFLSLAGILALIKILTEKIKKKKESKNFEYKDVSPHQDKSATEKHRSKESNKKNNSHSLQKKSKRTITILPQSKNQIIKGISILLIMINILGVLYGNIPLHRQSALVYYDDEGNLEYSLYANQGENQKVNKIPDFSFAGYRRGGQSLPNVPVKTTLSAIEGDNSPQIQEAINIVSQMPIKNGFRGAILLKAGKYRMEQPIKINASGIILRGEGNKNAPEGTELITTIAQKHDLIRIEGDGSGLPEVEGTIREITADYIPTGSNTIELSSTEGYSAGDRILVVRTPNQLWIDSLEMAQYGWTKESYTIKHERTITKIEENIITIDIPIVDPIQSKYGGGYVVKSNVTGRVEGCGVEKMRLTSTYTHAEDEDHGWNAIVLSRTCNSWVSNVIAQYFGYACVKIDDESNFNSIQDCAMLDPISQTTGGRKYSFVIYDGLGNLFHRCYARGGRHDFVAQSRVTGPNVWLDCLAEYPQNDIGPHHRWSTGNLFDSVQGGNMRVRDRGDSGTGHGWAGAQTMFWNCQSYSHYLMVSSPEGAMNWGIGCGKRKFEGDGYWEHWNRDIMPRSLYLAQLEERLEKESVHNITIPQQRSGTIYDYIRNQYI